MTDAWQSYLEMAMGLTKTSKKKAEKAVKELVGKGNAKASELQGMAESLVAAGLANRESLTKLVESELDRAMSKVGLVKAEEVAELRKRVAELEAKLAATAPAAAPLAEPAAPTAEKTAATPVAKKTAAKNAAAKKAPAKKTAGQG